MRNDTRFAALLRSRNPELYNKVQTLADQSCISASEYIENAVVFYFSRDRQCRLDFLSGLRDSIRKAEKRAEDVMFEDLISDWKRVGMEGKTEKEVEGEVRKTARELAEANSAWIDFFEY